MSWRKITFIIVALIVLLGGSAGLSLLFISMKPDPPRAPENTIIRSVKAATVNYGEIRSSLSRNGRIVPAKEVLLVAEASGKIEKGEVPLKEGASFKKGQLLGTIYRDEAELALKASKSSFLNTLSVILPNIKVDFPDEFDTYYGFFNSINLDEELPELPEIKDEKLKIYLSAQGVLKEYYTIKQEEKKLSRHSLYAPFNGSFTAVNYEVGSYINTGGQIAKMIETDELEIEVPVEILKSRWIKIGDQVKVYSEDKKVILPGYVVRKSNFIDADFQARNFYVKVPNTAEEFYTGQYLVVEFPGQVIESAMEIPRSGVFNSDEVFAVIDGKLKKQKINILKWNESTLIFNGLPEGMEIVTEALVNVKENSPVNIHGKAVPAQGIGNPNQRGTKAGR